MAEQKMRVRVEIDVVVTPVEGDSLPEFGAVCEAVREAVTYAMNHGHKNGHVHALDEVISLDNGFPVAKLKAADGYCMTDSGNLQLPDKDGKPGNLGLCYADEEETTIHMFRFSDGDLVETRSDDDDGPEEGQGSFKEWKDLLEKYNVSVGTHRG